MTVTEVDGADAGVDVQDRSGVQAYVRHGSEEGRDLVTGVARQLGLEAAAGGAGGDP